MKPILYTLLSIVCAALILHSCKKDDGKTNDTKSSIVGSWEASRQTLKTTFLGSNPPAVVTDIDTTFKAGQGYYTEYRADNSYIERLSPTATQVFDSGTYVLFADNSKITELSFEFSFLPKDTNNISISGNTMTVSRDDTSGGYHDVYSITYNRR